MNSVRLNHELHRLFYNFMHADRVSFWTGIAVLLFSLAFAVVGVLRWVEFNDFGFARVKKRILVTMHILGCLIFSLGFILLALDTNKEQNVLVGATFASAMLLLFPAHIYLGLLRRIRNKQKIG